MEWEKKGPKMAQNVDLGGSWAPRAPQNLNFGAQDPVRIWIFQGVLRNSHLCDGDEELVKTSTAPELTLQKLFLF